MGQLLVFRLPEEDRRRSTRRTDDAPADILFFTGVRYEREAPVQPAAMCSARKDEAGVPEGTPSGSRRGKRRA